MMEKLENEEIEEDKDNNEEEEENEDEKGEEKEDVKKENNNKNDFDEALSNVKPSINEKSIEQYIEWNKNFGSFQFEDKDE